MAARVCARKRARSGTESMIAGGMTLNDKTPMAEFVVAPITFISGVEEMKAKASSASASRGMEAANRMITEQRRSIEEPARRAAAMPSVSDIAQAIDIA